MEVALNEKEKEIVTKYFRRIDKKQEEITEIQNTISDIVAAIASRHGIDRFVLDVKEMKIKPLGAEE